MWFDKEAPEEAQVPEGYHISLDAFRKLLLSRYIQCEVVHTYIWMIADSCI